MKDKARKKKKKQAKVTFDENYDKFSIRSVYEFAMKRNEYEEDHPDQQLQTKYTVVND